LFGSLIKSGRANTFETTMSNTGRTEDIKELYHQIGRESNTSRRESLRRTINMIKNESGAISSMREALVKAHREGNTGNIKDIHERVGKDLKYRNDQH